MTIQIIVGLGNPGDKHALNRHNVGFWLVDLLAESWHGEWKSEAKFQAHVCKVRISGHEVWLLKPQTFMNLSGDAVGPFCRYYRIPVESCLVAYDELDIPSAQVRLKKGGGHGGHNGLRHIIQHYGRELSRMRIGIGHPGHKNLVSAYVLSNPPGEEREQLIGAVRDAAEQVPHLIKGDWDRAVRNLHGGKS